MALEKRLAIFDSVLDAIAGNRGENAKEGVWHFCVQNIFFPFLTDSFAEVFKIVKTFSFDVVQTSLGKSHLATLSEV